jgi:hypothetical protein
MRGGSFGKSLSSFGGLASCMVMDLSFLIHRHELRLCTPGLIVSARAKVIYMYVDFEGSIVIWVEYEEGIYDVI